MRADGETNPRQPVPSPTLAVLKTRRLDAAVHPRKSDDASATGRIQASLSRRRLHSVPCRKRQLPVVGADGSTSAARERVLRHTRAVAALHSTSQNASGSAPRE